MAQRRRKKKRFRMQPRFFLILVLLLGVTVIVLLLVKKLKGGDEDAAGSLENTPLPTATAAPTATPKPSLPPSISVVRSEDANPTKFGFSTALKVAGKDVDSYSRSESINFGRDSEYTEIPGVLTFGGNNYRNSFSYGSPVISDKRLKMAWSTNIGALSSWSGTGWTGQPLIVHWPDATLQVLGVGQEFKEQEGGLTEVIYPAMDGNIYFIDLHSGKATRSPINSGVVQKGTACLDPRGYPLLFVGQGIPVTNEQGNDAAYIRVYNLITNEEIHRFGGFDYFGRRIWQAYDGSPMITGDTLVYAGENGVLYTCKLNASFDPASGALSIDPEGMAKMNYQGSGYSKSDALGSRWYGIESSVTAFRNYLYYTDNGGRLQCVDANTLQLKFVTDVTDETDSTIVVDESYDDNTIYLYTGSQVRSSNGNFGEGYGYSYQRKINGLTGAVVWEKTQLCSIGDATSSGGCVATPHVGHGPIGNLVIYAFSLAAVTGESTAPATPAASPGATDAPEDAMGDDAAAAAGTAVTPDTASAAYSIGGRIVAYDKTSGEMVWSIEQTNDYWSSPVVVYDDTNNKAYLLQCDRGGMLTMYDAATSTQLNTIDLGSRIDSTPAVYDNMLVVGTRGKGGSGEPAKICCVQIN